MPVLPLLFLSAAIAIVAIVNQLSVRVPRRLLVAGIAGSAVWAAVAHAVPAPVSARVEGEELDGLLAEDVVDPQAGNGWARHADAARGRREMATWTDEFLPRGRFSLDFDLRSDRPGELVEVLVPLEGGGMAAKQLLRLRGTGGYERLRVTGNLDRDTSVKVVVTTVGKARIWLDGFDLDAGLPTGMEGALFGEPGVREAEIDFGGEGPWANWQKEGWSGREKTGEGLTFQWTTGTKSVLLVPITKPYDLVVDLRALPFDPPGAGPQRLDLLVNGLEAGSMTLRPGWQWYRLSVPRSSLRSGPNRFELLHARAIRPMYVPGAGSDARELAVAYDVLRLTRR